MNSKEAIEIIGNKLGLDLYQVVLFSEAGSKLYGTATDNSDEDYLGIFLPKASQLLLNDFPKQVSYKTDILDIQMWSLHYFMKLAYEGETLAIDLLHGTKKNWLLHRPFWGEHLVKNRKYFYTKKMKAFASYARKQAAKYGIKGKRIETLEVVVNHLKKLNQEDKLAVYWNNLPEGEHIHFLNDEEPYRMYMVCGKKMLETVKVGYALEQFERSLNDYGKRAQQARENKGVDWKAVSHAIRANYVVLSILKNGGFDYPLENCDFIRDVKLGKLDFITEVQPILEDTMDEIERLMDVSDLPETVDKIMWNRWLVNTIDFHVLNERADILHTPNPYFVCNYVKSRKICN